MKRPRPKYQVFISSTFEDLRDERESVIREILTLRQIPVGMEVFTATDDRGWRTIIPLIDLTDYYILILAGRYGSIDRETGKSWTHLEYEHAFSKRIPVLSFIRDLTEIKVTHTDQGEGAREKQDKLRQFIAQVKDKHHAITWRDKEDLAKKVGASLANHIREDEDSDSPRPGWFRGDSIIFSPNAVDEMARLSAENNTLRHELAKLHEANNVELAILNAEKLPLEDLTVNRKFLIYREDRTMIDPFGPDSAAYKKFIDRQNRIIWLKLKIINKGTSPASDVVVDISASPVDEMLDRSDPLPSMIRVPIGRSVALGGHVYIDSTEAVNNTGKMRQRIKTIAPGITESLLPFGLLVHGEGGENLSQTSIIARVNYCVTDRSGKKCEGEFIATAVFDGIDRLNSKTIIERFD